MINVTNSNLLDFINAYFDSIGLGAEAKDYFTSKNFIDGLILKLSAVCLVPQNKPVESRSNQTHIHVTGHNRYFFFDPTLVDSAITSSQDCEQNVVVSKQNIKALNGEVIVETGLCLYQSHTMKKIACRRSQETQVQISKLQLDDKLFLDLRNGLYEGDLLVFLKPRAGDYVVVVGIPSSFYMKNYNIVSSEIFSRLRSKRSCNVKKALTALSNEYNDNDVVDCEEFIVDAVYQELLNNAPATTTFYEPVKYDQALEGQNVTKTIRPKTNPSLGKEVISRNNYCCEVDIKHETFINKTGFRYMEAHHLIPLEWQREFEYKLDTRANIVPLCPRCHKLLHYGRIEEVKPILIRLYNEHIEALRKCGLDITIDQLIRFYE